jgi:hypothetical protein
MKNRTLTLEHALFALALLLALGLRFLHLGRLPLSDSEAGWALQAMQVADGERPAVGANPAYVHLTTALFFVFDATNFLARFWPALAGSLLVLAAWMLRGRLGRVPALILAFGLALDPGLAALSRQAGGPMLAIAAIVFTIRFWRDGRRSAAGVTAGLAVLAGPSVWFGLLGFGLAWALEAWIGPRQPRSAEPAPATAATPFGWLKAEGLKQAAISMGVTVLLLGTLLMLSPAGLPGFVASILEYLRGWWTLSDTPLWSPFLALPAYELLPLGFGIAAVVRGILRKDRLVLRFGYLVLAGLLLVLLYPSKQSVDIGWLLFPLWVLAALELAQHLDFSGVNRWEVLGVATLVFVLLVFGWLELASAISQGVASEMARTRLMLMLAAVLLVVLSLLLVGAGWTLAVARLGGVWGAVLALGLFTIAMATGATGLREPLTVELWSQEPRPGHLALIEKVANDISNLNAGMQRSLPVTIVGLDSPALLWQFRRWDVQVVASLPPGMSPELVLTPFDMQMELVADYSGEALVLRQMPDWSTADLNAWLKWFVYRELPVLSEDLILWVRSDLMLDSPQPAAVP